MTFNPTVLFDARIYFGAADLTGRSNKVDLGSSSSEEKITNFASGGSEERVGGIFDTQLGLDGFFEAGDLSMPDDTFWASVGVATQPLTIVPTSGAVGQLAYHTRGMTSEYKVPGEEGKVLPWNAAVKGNWPLARGTIIHPQGTARTTNGSGTGLQLGSVSAAQRLYANLHVFSITGSSTPTITVTIESSVDNTFAAPTTRITYAAATAIGGQASSVLGAITDTWWRATWTIGGSSPSFLFAVSAGIAAK